MKWLIIIPVALVAIYVAVASAVLTFYPSQYESR